MSKLWRKRGHRHTRNCFQVRSNGGYRLGKRRGWCMCRTRWQWEGSRGSNTASRECHPWSWIRNHVRSPSLHFLDSRSYKNRKSCTVLISGKAVCVHDGTWKDCEVSRIFYWILFPVRQSNSPLEWPYSDWLRQTNRGWARLVESVVGFLVVIERILRTSYFHK